jgi:hypothetical protein
MDIVLPMRKNARAQEDRDFAEWLRGTVRKLKQGELPPKSWEQRHSPFDDSAAQRRIAKLIAEIAERRKVEKEAAERLRNKPH